MTTAANELLMVIHAKVTGNAALATLIGGDGLRDRLVNGQRLPCIVIADVVTNDYSTASEAGEEHLLTLEVWSETGGQRQAQEIAQMLRSLLEDEVLTLEGHVLVGLQHRSTRGRRETKTKLHVAEVRFRAVTEPVE